MYYLFHEYFDASYYMHNDNIPNKVFGSKDVVTLDEKSQDLI